MGLRIPADLTRAYTRFGVTIRRLGLAELEILRQRRTDPELARFMIFRDDITPAQQLAWFERIDNRENLYGTLWWQGELIGVTNLKDIDADACAAEGGMMIWDQAQQNSLVPFRAALVGTDLAFWEYGFERMTARVLATNQRARRFNRALGYRFDTPPDEHGVVTGWLSNPNYWRATRSIRALLDQQDGTTNGGAPWPAHIPALPDEPDEP